MGGILVDASGSPPVNSDCHLLCRDGIYNKLWISSSALRDFPNISQSLGDLLYY